MLSSETAVLVWPFLFNTMPMLSSQFFLAISTDRAHRRFFWAPSNATFAAEPYGEKTTPEIAPKPGYNDIEIAKVQSSNRLLWRHQNPIRPAFRANLG